MNFNLIWQTVLIFIVGTVLLRIGGRKSISQMTIPETVIVIAIGTLIIQPVTGNGLWVTFVLAAVLIACLILTEYIELTFNKSESLITGKAVPVIENGVLNKANLKKFRLTVDKLEKRLRQSGIIAITDVQYATLETSGQIGYTLKPEKQPATKEDIQKIIQLIQTGHMELQAKSSNENIFTEINQDQNKTLQ
ncbi:DUF421 domain-containing protein [Pueribacillus theae]|uniref:DUF421 domain-containing protein n=1 Tax=Pueribacillus theae TaxID=2171751 RepID=A0A2U1JZJ7_9BACI|nr:YetF domain-containing protein [Pueribacillus theae]PWA10369.1 DUF421 domain-containing protein [Pueribacillus theae]